MVTAVRRRTRGAAVGTAANRPLTPLNWIDRLPEEARRAVRGRMRTERLAPGQAIWFSGQVRDGIVQIVSGRITLYSGSTDGRELHYCTFSEGDCLGEDSLSGPVLHHHSTKAEAATLVSILPVADFWDLTETWPAIHRELYRHHARKSKLLFEYLDSIALDPVDAKIAGRICLIMTLKDGATDQVSQPVLDISHSGLADMTGLTRQTVSAVLHRWRRAGLIEQHYRKLVVLNPKALHNIRESRDEQP